MKLGIRKFLVATAVSSILFGAVQVAADDAPQTQNPFTITLPEGFGAFATQAQSVDAPDGKIETTNWISKAPTGEAVVVTVSKMPAKILSPEKLIHGTRESLLKSLKATLETEEPGTGTIPSSNILFKSEGAWLRSRLMVDDEHVYQLLYVGRSEEQRALPAVGSMFDSFNVAPQAAAAAPADEPAAEPQTATDGQ